MSWIRNTGLNYGTIYKYINTYVHLQAALGVKKLDTSEAAQLHGPLQGKGLKAWTPPGQN